MNYLKVRSDAWWRTYNAALTGLVSRLAAMPLGGEDAAEYDRPLHKRAEAMADLAHEQPTMEIRNDQI
jgi:hypothetical protein